MLAGFFVPLRRQKNTLHFETMFSVHISPQFVLFFILYGITGVVPFIASVYLLLRKGNAFAPDISPPLRLRRWAASFFAVASLGHIWWLVFYLFSSTPLPMDEMMHSTGYAVMVTLDCVTLLTTIAGTLLAMLQDRKRRIWPAFVAMIPFVALGCVYIAHPSDLIAEIALAYILLLYVLFTVYMVFAVRRYGQWLNNNYADLENKKVWLSLLVTLGCMLLFILYVLVRDIALTYVLHLTELMLFCLLLWRVETLPLLESVPAEQAYDMPGSEAAQNTADPSQAEQTSAMIANFDINSIEGLLAEQCVDTKLYLQHDLTLQQLAQTIGTNRSYLSQYFSRQGITYNTYINDLRIRHFISLCQEAARNGQTIVAQQLASESGYHCYSTFSLAFKQRTGQSVSAWLRQTIK